MAESERFSPVKFVASFGQLLPWVKTVRYALGFLGVGFIGLTIYRAYFMPTNKQVTQIVAQSGSQVTVVEEKKKENKKLLSIHPFVEGYGFVESDERKGAGAKAGVRIDF